MAGRPHTDCFKVDAVTYMAEYDANGDRACDAMSVICG